MVQQNKWKLMLVDYGFARALETEMTGIVTNVWGRDNLLTHP